MALVEALATVFALLGWGTVALTTYLVVSGGLLTSQMFRSPQAMQVAIVALTPLFLLSLGPFLGWGILQGLVEIHRRLQQIDDRLGIAATAVHAPSVVPPGSVAVEPASPEEGGSAA